MGICPQFDPINFFQYTVLSLIFDFTFSKCFLHVLKGFVQGDANVFWMGCVFEFDTFLCYIQIPVG